MTQDRFSRLKEILLAAFELEGDHRDRFLGEACRGDLDLRREIESLLHHADDDPTILQTFEANDHFRHPSGGGPRVGASHPASIGPYQIVGVLGQGGMGIVYHARQVDPIKRDVALKLIKEAGVTGNLVTRFETERQTLALMDHPLIAKVLDAGADEAGRPFFVMELVQGAPLTEYCHEQRLSLRDRLLIVTNICKAVQHAHQKGVIHRDLKPSNILVSDQDGEATPKVIDFGIAKVVEEFLVAGNLTAEGQPLGTLNYMSPEQAQGLSTAIDTRSDIYALGTIIFELIAGRPPFESDDGSFMSQVRAICNNSAPRLSESETGDPVDSDLQTITAKALEKLPADRYQSASALAEDIERYLSRQPILAHPPSTAYQIRKLVSRNKFPAALIGSLLVLVVGFGIWMSAMYARSEANFRRAITAEGEAGQVTDFMVSLFQISEPGESRGNTITAREILDAGALRIEAELREQPVIQARMMRTMGTVYRGLGVYGKADTLLTTALAKLEARPSGSTDRERIETLVELANVQQRQGDFEKALGTYEVSLDLMEEELGQDDPLIASCLVNQAMALTEVGRTEEAEELLLRSLAIFEAAAEATSPQYADALNNLAQTKQWQGHYAEAESLMVRVLLMNEALYPDDHPELARGLTNLSSLYWQMGRYDDAEPLARRSVAIWEVVLGPNHPDLAMALVNLAALLDSGGKPEEAVPLLERALEIQTESLETDHPDIAVALNNLGLISIKLGEYGAAEDAFHQSLGMRERAMGESHPMVSNVLISLGDLYLARGTYEQAESVLIRALGIREAFWGRDDPRTALPLNNLGVVRLRQQKYQEADSLLTEALDVRRATLPPDHPRIAESYEWCAESARVRGLHAEADSLAQCAVQIRSR